MNYKDQVPLNERIEYYLKLQSVHPNRIFVICEKHKKSVNFQQKCIKLAIEKGTNFKQVIKLIQKLLDLRQDQAIYLHSENNTLLSQNMIIDELSNHQKEQQDGFFYIKYSEIETFG